MGRGGFLYGSGFEGRNDDDGFLVNSVMSRNGSGSSASLVLDSERDELVAASVKVGRKGSATVAERSFVALRNHSEAERRRRARINAHLGSLRNLVPGGKKMDKAALLTQVITHLKVLKRTASESSERFLTPDETDEITVEQAENDGANSIPYSFIASICCDYVPGLLSDLRRALDSLHLIINGAEISTLQGRMTNVFVLTSPKEESIKDIEVYQAIRSVLDRFSVSFEFSIGT